jgi:type I restriction enzyme M protein
MDASQYKDYVLTLLFVKYVSDKAKADPYALIEVPEDGSFDYLITLKGRPDVGERVNVAIRKLAEANGLQGVINNADFDDPTKLGSGKDLQDKVSNLIGIFQDMDFSGSKAEGDDLLGDAYEYLMRHFATQSGKSKGQFYTPAEVSRVMAQLLQIPAGTARSTTVYDPTCGSGSLLIKVADASPHGLTIYGQENDNATWALARMNMILHGNETHEIVLGNTLADPKFRNGDKLDTFDYLVANPPFSHKTWKNGFDKDYDRFEGYAWPPDKNGDYAFLLHMVKSLKSTGRGVTVMPHGVLFRGNTEATIRKELIKRGYIKAIIGLPANLFYGTGIPACLVVLDKKDAAGRAGIFMIDASKGFEKDGPKNRLRPVTCTRSSTPSSTRKRSTATRAWCRLARSPTPRMTTTLTSRGTSTAPSQRISRICVATCRVASPIATSMLCSRTGMPSPPCALSCSSHCVRATHS